MASPKRMSSPSPQRKGSASSQRMGSPSSQRMGSPSSQRRASSKPNTTPEEQARYYVGRMRMHLEEIGQLCVLQPHLVTTELVHKKIDQAEENFAGFIRIAYDYKLVPYTAAFDNKLALYRDDATDLLSAGEEGAAELLVATDSLIRHLFYQCGHGWAEILFSDQDFYFLVPARLLPLPTATEQQQEPPNPPSALMDPSQPEGVEMVNPTHVRTGKKPWWYNGPARKVVYEDAAIQLRQDDVIRLPTSYMPGDPSNYRYFATFYQVKGADANNDIFIARGDLTNNVSIDVIKRVWTAFGN